MPPLLIVSLYFFKLVRRNGKRYRGGSSEKKNMVILLQISNKTEVGRDLLHPKLNRIAGYDWKHMRFDRNIIYRPKKCVDCAAHIECILCILVCSTSSATHQ
jgi:hypothetical protein